MEGLPKNALEWKLFVPEAKVTKELREILSSYGFPDSMLDNLDHAGLALAVRTHVVPKSSLMVEDFPEEVRDVARRLFNYKSFQGKRPKQKFTEISSRDDKIPSKKPNTVIPNHKEHNNLPSQKRKQVHSDSSQDPSEPKRPKKITWP